MLATAVPLLPNRVALELTMRGFAFDDHELESRLTAAFANASYRAI
jgi:hypothetical protein